MSVKTKKCKVCGKDYEACHTLKRNPNVYRWQDVACCPEHGAEYLRQVLISRGELAEEHPLDNNENIKDNDYAAKAVIDDTKKVSHMNKKDINTEEAVKD